MPAKIYTMLARSGNNGRDVSASVKDRHKDIQPGTIALLILLRGVGEKADMTHVAWRTLGTSSRAMS